MSKIGFVVNPIAGVGGRAGHKGSDDPVLRARAMAEGAEPPAMARSKLAASLLAGVDDVEILTWGGPMGEWQLAGTDADVAVLGHPEGDATEASDTRKAAEAMAESGADLLLFVGGDGTARDILDAVGEHVPAIGIPSGVKMYSGVFAPHPRRAVVSAERFLSSAGRTTSPAEVLDIDEERLRHGVVATHLYGYLQVPSAFPSTQGMKSPAPKSDSTAIRGIGAAIAASLGPDYVAVLGPGSTLNAVGDALGSGSTLLGVDIVQNGRLVVEDGGEESLLTFLSSRSADRLIVSPIGGQGFVFGRGNQQISPNVVRAVGIERVEIVVSPGKLQALEGRPLLVDTGDEKLDRELAAWRTLTVGPDEKVVYPVEAAGGRSP